MEERPMMSSSNACNMNNVTMRGGALGDDETGAHIGDVRRRMASSAPRDRWGCGFGAWGHGGGVERGGGTGRGRQGRGAGPGLCFGAILRPLSGGEGLVMSPSWPPPGESRIRWCHRPIPAGRWADATPAPSEPPVTSWAGPGPPGCTCGGRRQQKHRCKSKSESGHFRQFSPFCWTNQHISRFRIYCHNF